MTYSDDAEGQALLPLLNVGRQMDRLRDELQIELTGHPDANVRALAGQLVEVRAGDAVHIVLVGQHDGGKSLLVRGLTGREDIAVGAGPLTDRSTAYPWHGHRIYDTPGVEAGVNEEHDRIADDALGVAHAVLFVLTVEGLDDLIAGYFLRVLDRLRTSRPLIVVVNKSRSERSDRVATEQDLRRALGPILEQVPVVWTDAKQWAQADRSADPAGSRAASGLPELAETTTNLVIQAGAAVQLMTPLRSWSEVTQRALRVLSASQDEASGGLAQLDEALALVEQQHVDRLAAVALRADEAVSTLTDGLRQAGPDVQQEQMKGLVQIAADTFDDRLNEDVARLDDRLRADVAVIAEDLISAPQLGRAAVRAGLEQLAGTFSGAAVRPGGAGHQLVSSVFRALRIKARPWGIVKVGTRIGQYASRANVVLTAGTIAWELFTVRRDAQRRQQQVERVLDWHDRAHQEAQAMVGEWRVEAERASDELRQLQAERVTRERLDVLSTLTQHDEGAARLVALEHRSQKLFKELVSQV